jgi:Zn-dependent M28 family amino/carboxypeptidase
MARHFRQRPAGRELIFALFSNEEPPFFGGDGMGSVIFVRGLDLEEAPIAFAMSLETMGSYSEAPNSQDYPWPLSWVYPDKGNFIGFVGNHASRGLVKDTVGTFRDVAQFPSEGIAMNEDPASWSDHAAFWTRKIPALMVTDTAPFRYAHYHTAEDTVDKDDFERLARVVLGLIRTVDRLSHRKDLALWDE